MHLNGIYFAFDSIKDKEIIETNLQLWRKYFKKTTNMYVLCGFDEDGIYDENFYAKDIENTFERIKICIKYGVFPYIMRYQKYKNAPEVYKGMYINLASWCNQRSMFVKYSLEGWGDALQELTEKQRGKKYLYSTKKYNMLYAGKHPEIAYEYYDLNYNEHSEYKYEKDSKEVKYDKRVSQIKLKKQIAEESKNIINKSEIIIDDISKSEILTLEDIDSNKKEYRLRKKYISDLLNVNHNIVLINSKDEILTDLTKNIIRYHIFMNIDKDVEIFVYNNDLKSFTNTKEFIENETILKYREVVTFKTQINKNSVYCSRYNLKDSKKIFNLDDSYNKASLLQDICEAKSNDKNSIISYFDNHGLYRKIGKLFKQRKWICFKINRDIDNNRVIDFIKATIKDTETVKQLELEDKNIG